MSGSGDGGHGPGRRARRAGAVRRIADTLGVPVERLMRSAGSDEFPDEVAELIRLWFKIRDPDAQRRIIGRVRGTAAG